MTCRGRSRILALMANVLPTVLFAATMLGGGFNGAENLVFANRNSQHNQVCLGDGRGRFTCADISPHSFNSFAVALGDLNGDRHLDALFPSGWSTKSSLSWRTELPGSLGLCRYQHGYSQELRSGAR